MEKEPLITPEITKLKEEYDQLIAKAMNKEGDFHELVREANTKLYKIHVIRRKKILKSKYGSEHGISDDLGFKVIE